VRCTWKRKVRSSLRGQGVECETARMEEQGGGEGLPLKDGGEQGWRRAEVSDKFLNRRSNHFWAALGTVMAPSFQRSPMKCQ
jgi:hypothetical protein